MVKSRVKQAEKIFIRLGRKNLEKRLHVLSDQAYLTSWHQCCRYNSQSTNHIQQNSEKAYNYYVKLLLGLIGICSAL